MFFRDVIGHDDLKNLLRETARSGIVPHARMFCGQEGYGGFQLALAYARYLNCTGRSATDSCGTCPSCVKYNEFVHPDLHFVFPMVTSTKPKKTVCDDYLPEWREFLKSRITAQAYWNIDMWLSEIKADTKQSIIYAAESDSIIRKMSFRIAEANYRVLFVWMPERMNSACANKLLKLIEEPPANTAILMVTDSAEKVLGTIVSRSQLLQIHPIPQEDIAKTLVDRWGLQTDDAAQIAHLSGGNYIKAIEQLTVDHDQGFFLEQFKVIMRNGWTKDVGAMKAFAEEMADMSRERQKNFLSFCQKQIRENFIYNLHESALTYMNREEKVFSERFSPFVNERNVFDLVEELSLAERHIHQNVNSKMVFFDLSMRIIVLIKR